MKKWKKGLLFIATCMLLSIGVFTACKEEGNGSSSSSDSENSSVSTSVDTVAPIIGNAPADKTGENALEAGTIYDFSADRDTVQTTDDSGKVEVRVVDIAAENGRSVYSASYISSYQFTKVGKYVVTLAVSDLSENVAYARYKIEVVDTKAPILVGENNYRAELDDAYNVYLPKIDIEEYSTYSVSYQLKTQDGSVVPVNIDGLVIAPKIGNYTLVYTVTDEYEHSSSFETAIEIYNPAPSVIINNEIGNIWTSEAVSLPEPSVQRLSDYSVDVYLLQDAAETYIEDTSSYVFTQGGKYTVRYKVNGTYYLGGEMHKEDGSEAQEVVQDVLIEVENLGEIDFEIHNGKKLTVSSTRADGVVKLVDSEDFGDGSSLKFDWLRIGDGRGVIFEKAIPLPENYDAIRMYIQAGGSKPIIKWADSWIADDKGNRVSMETLYTEEAIDGAYYTLSLASNSLKNVKTIYIANSYGAGETYKDENGSIWEVGETRDFYLDNISFVIKPTLFIDEAVFEEFRYEGDSLALPIEQVANYADNYEFMLSYVLNGGEKVAMDGYVIDSLEAGTYEFFYNVNAGGAKLEKKISYTVFERVPSIVYRNEIGLLRAGTMFTIPTAQAVFVADGTVVTTQYKHDTDADFTVGSTIMQLKAGEYTVKYSADGCTDVSYTFTVLEENVYKHTFNAVNSGIDGDGTAVGNSDYSATIENGIATLNGWWSGVKFEEALTLDGATALVIRVKGAATCSGVHFRYYGENNAIHTTEDYSNDMGFTAVTITTEYTDFIIPLRSGVTTVYGFEILNRRTELYVDEICLWKAPVWSVDSSVFEGFLYIGEELRLPTATVDYQGEYETSVSYSVDGGESILAVDNTIPTLVDGKYTIVYTLLVDGIALTEKFTFAPIEKVPFILVDTTPIQAQEGDIVTLPVAQSVNMDGLAVITKYCFENGEWIEGTSIDNVQIGVYTVVYTAIYDGETYTETLTVTVVEKPTFKVNGNEVGVTATQGTATVESDGSLKLTGAWWVNVALNGAEVPDGATKMTIRLKANTTLNVLYRFSNNGSINGSMCYDEAAGFALTTEYQDITISINSSEELTHFGLCVCDDGSGVWRMVYVESITFA